MQRQHQAERREIIKQAKASDDKLIDAISTHTQIDKRVIRADSDSVTLSKDAA